MQERQRLQPERPGKVGERLKKWSANSETAGQLGFGPIGKSIIQSLPVGVVIFDTDLKIIETNSQAAKLIELADYLDRTLAQGTGGSSSSKQEWTKRLKSVIATGKTQKFKNINYRFFKSDKTKLLRIVCIPLSGGNESLIQGSDYVNRTEQVTAADDETKEGQTYSGTVIGGAVIIEDVTEKADIQRQLTSAQKLATVGKLASRVAHELNNPMDGILR